MELRTKKRILWYITLIILLLSPYNYFNTQLKATAPSKNISPAEFVENIEIQWSEDDKQIAKASTTGIHLINVNTGEIEMNITDDSEYRPMRLTEARSSTRDMDWNYQENLIALSINIPDEIRVFSTQTQNRINIIEEAPKRLDDRDFYISDFDWRPNSDQLLYSTTDGRLVLWEAETNSAELLLDLPSWIWINEVSWNSEGDKFVFYNEEELNIFDMNQNNVTLTKETRTNPGSVKWQQVKIITGLKDGMVTIYDPNLTEINTIQTPIEYGDVIDVKLNPQQTELLVTVWGENSILYNMENFEFIGEIYSMGMIDSKPSWNNAGDKIAYDNTDFVRFWNVESVYENLDEYMLRKYGGSASILLVGVIFAGLLKFKLKVTKRNDEINVQNIVDYAENKVHNN